MRLRLLWLAAAVVIAWQNSAWAQAELVSVSGLGGSASDASRRVAVSGDGRFVAFESDASDLVPDDRNNRTDVFVRDRESGSTIRVSVGSQGREGNFGSFSPAISRDGRFVAFVSRAANLVPNDRNLRSDVFVRDLAAGTTERVSVSLSGSNANGGSWAPSISADGRYVAFESRASNLVEGDRNRRRDVFVFDRTMGTTRRVSVSTEGEEADRISARPSISDDGRFVAFQSRATNLSDSDGRPDWDIYVHDLESGATEFVNVAVPDEISRLSNRRPIISGDGRFVALESWALRSAASDGEEEEDPEEDGSEEESLESGAFGIHEPGNGEVQYIVRFDRMEGRAELVSAYLNGLGGFSFSAHPTISADGRFVSFQTRSNEIFGAGGDDHWMIGLRDMHSGAMTRADLRPDGSAPADSSMGPSLSADGRYVAFVSHDDALVAGDNNDAPDAFIARSPVELAASVPVSAAAGGTVEVIDEQSPINGAAVEIPPGALSGDARITIADSRDPARSDGEGHVSAGMTVEFGPESLTFTNSVRLAVPYFQDVPDDAELRVLAQETLDDAGELLEPVEIDTDRHRVWVEVDHFSYYTTICISRCVTLRAVGLDSRATSGTQGSGESRAPSVSADGRYVAFESLAANLVGGDTGRRDVFVRDRGCAFLNPCFDGLRGPAVLDPGGMPDTIRVSESYSGGQANGDSQRPFISASGRYVVFESNATNLVRNVAGLRWRVYLRDVVSGKTELVSVNDAGTDVDVAAQMGSISDDGRFVVFRTWGLVGSNEAIHLRDRYAETTRRLRGLGSSMQSFGSDVPMISGNGRFVVFAQSVARTDGKMSFLTQDVYLTDLRTGDTELVSITADGALPDGTSGVPYVSYDGRFIAFESTATNIVSPLPPQPPAPPCVSYCLPLPPKSRVYLRDRGEGQTALISVGVSGYDANAGSYYPSVSDSGQFVVYSSDASNLVRRVRPFEPADTNGRRDVFIYSKIDNATFRLSSGGYTGVESNDNSDKPRISATGNLIAFESKANNLMSIPGVSSSDTNGTWDVFGSSHPYLPHLSVKSVETLVKAGEGWLPIELEAWDASAQLISDFYFSDRHCGVVELTGGSDLLLGATADCAVEGRLVLDGIVPCPGGEGRVCPLPISYEVAEDIAVSFATPGLTSTPDVIVTVVPGEPSRLDAESVPNTLQIAGQSWFPTPVFSVRDAFGNLIASDNTTALQAVVHYGSTSFLGETYEVASGGVIAFDNMTYPVAEDILIGFDDVSNQLNNTESSFFVVRVLPGLPDHLALLAPPASPQTAGATWQPPIRVGVLDQFGNLVGSDGSTVLNIANVQGSGFAAASTTTVSASGGIGTFDGLSYEAAETVQFDIVEQNALLDASVTSGISVTIAPAAPKKLVFGTPPPASVPAGAVWPAFTVLVQDEFGNVVTADNAVQATVSVIQGTSSFSAGSATAVAAQNGVLTFDALTYPTSEEIRIRIAAPGTTLDISGVGDTVVSITGDAAGPRIDQVNFPCIATDTQSLEIVGENYGDVGAELRIEAPAGNVAFSTPLNALVPPAGYVEDNASGPDRIFIYGPVPFISFPTQIVVGASGVDTDQATVSVPDPVANCAGAPPPYLALGTPPASVQIAGEQWGAFTVEIRSQAMDEIIPFIRSEIQVELSVGTDTLEGMLGAVPVNGIATFTDLSYNKEELIEFDFSVVEGGVNPLLSVPITVIHNIPNLLALNVPPPRYVDAGALWAPFSVEVQDQFGNPIPDASNVVTLSAFSGSGTLSGTVSKPASNGVVQFDDISYDTAGYIDLEFVSPGLLPLTGITVAVTAGGLIEFVPAVVDFGIVNADTILPLPDRTYVIRNISGSDVELTGGAKFIVQGTADEFENRTLLPLPPDFPVLHPGEELLGEVSFDPQGPGERRVELYIEANGLPAAVGTATAQVIRIPLDEFSPQWDGGNLLCLPAFQIVEEPPISQSVATLVDDNGSVVFEDFPLFNEPFSDVINPFFPSETPPLDQGFYTLTLDVLGTFKGSGQFEVAAPPMERILTTIPIGAVDPFVTPFQGRLPSSVVTLSDDRAVLFPSTASAMTQGLVILQSDGTAFIEPSFPAIKLGSLQRVGALSVLATEEVSRNDIVIRGLDVSSPSIEVMSLPFVRYSHWAVLDDDTAAAMTYGADGIPNSASGDDDSLVVVTGLLNGPLQYAVYPIATNGGSAFSEHVVALSDDSIALLGTGPDYNFCLMWDFNCGGDDRIYVIGGLDTGSVTQIWVGTPQLPGRIDTGNVVAIGNGALLISLAADRTVRIASGLLGVNPEVTEVSIWTDTVNPPQSRRVEMHAMGEGLGVIAPPGILVDARGTGSPVIDEDLITNLVGGVAYRESHNELDSFNVLASDRLLVDAGEMYLIDDVWGERTGTPIVSVVDLSAIPFPETTIPEGIDYLERSLSSFVPAPDGSSAYAVLNFQPEYAITTNCEATPPYLVGLRGIETSTPSVSAVGYVFTELASRVVDYRQMRFARPVVLNDSVFVVPRYHAEPQPVLHRYMEPDRVLKVLGGSGDDVVSIETATDGEIAILVNGVSLSPASPILESAYARIQIVLGTGNDEVMASAYTGKLPITVEGGPGNDAIFGGPNSDQLFGEDGDDVLDGGLGNDELRGGKGIDILVGNEGEDALWGGSGNDSLDGGNGIDDFGDGGEGTNTCIALETELGCNAGSALPPATGGAVPPLPSGPLNVGQGPPYLFPPINSVSIAQGENLALIPLVTDPATGQPVTGLTFTDNGTLPAWISLDANAGALTGTPLNEHVGVYEGILLTVQSPSGAVVSSNVFSITVSNVNDPPVIETPTLPSAAVDRPFSAQVTAADPDLVHGDELWFYLEGAPLWLAIGPRDGVLTGVPQVGDVGVVGGVRVRVADAAGASVLSGVFSVKVEPSAAQQCVNESLTPLPF